ncbi:MAG TPA: hypothetical protein VGN32_03720 [Ktedonobacterales bacterium]|nr:hypothetical protein [Ktedonobacterales bacterium]
MPQTTLDRVSGQVSDQTRSMMQRGRQQMQRGRQQMQRARQAFQAGAQPTLGQRLRGANRRANWRVPARVAWHAGRLVGQVQGARTLAPHAARGWWVGVAGRGGTRTQQLGRMARWAGITFVGTRIASRAWPTLRDLRQSTQRGRPTRAGRGRAQGILATQVPAIGVPATTALQNTQRTWRRLRRSQLAAVLQPTPVRTTPPWLWPALLSLGFALGVLVGYSFTPGAGSVNVWLRQRRDVPDAPDARFSDA